MLTAIPEADIQKTRVNSISVGSIGIGPVTIGQLVITNLELNTAADGAFLRNFVVTVTYNMKLDWHLHIDLPGNPNVVAPYETAERYAVATWDRDELRPVRCDCLKGVHR